MRVGILYDKKTQRPYNQIIYKTEKQSNKKFSGLTDIVPKNKKAQKYLHISNESWIVSNKVRKNHNTPIKAYAAKSFCWIALTISGFIYERLLDQSSLYSII